MRIDRILWMTLVCVALVGFFRGWFSMSSDRESSGKKLIIHLTVDLEKVNADSESVRERARRLTE